MENLLDADLPALQRATVDAIAKAVDHAGELYGFAVASIELFDGGKRLEVGTEPTGKTALNKPCFIGIKVEGSTVAALAKDFAEGFEMWAARQVTHILQ